MLLHEHEDVSDIMAMSKTVLKSTCLLTLASAKADMLELRHEVLAARFLFKGMRFHSNRDGRELIADVLRSPAQHRHWCEVIFEDSEAKVQFDIEWERCS